ncbi:hypothetical protein A3C57_02610 [Candidatus Nomurabacteria bacterium RIFCSPHIGHO2_02_FULL_33_12]|uniref:Phosphoglucosamine mutase n=1 Tax=Candidatus Nomurabacteria bacterium RIFCSPLOWO2_01_FULL_33_17 TaxID=1801764 RepID=A0A1F6WPI6_9BACT|nr:MAG: hypothetical protein A3C57_02610 [Candidatus Nomurabacteria bacterium RIFCSPHIGHO2_02_FULL_33_12]OGI83822.1 MAG: hypothetical protein A2903_00205 [Candidatus Nomurabacteria bacterium RIFCSPLOWO2_01_FULL_33_17]
MNLDRLTISGFRGLLGTELTDETVVLLVKAFIDPLLVSPLAGGESHNKKQTNKLHILIGRDGRESGIHIEEIIVKTLVENGINVTVGGILTTPSVLYLTKTLTFDAGIIITASHNPIEYNGLKFVNNDGFFVSHEFIQKMKDGINLGDMVPNNESVMGEIIYDSTLAKRYTDHIISSFSKLKTKMRVIVDPVNSSGSIMSPEFLRGLGCEVIMINDEPIGIFARQAEPNPQALLELGRATLGYAMDIGFGLDPDGDRLALVDENGIPVFEEYTLALCAKAVYEKLKKENVLSSAGPLVINLSSSNTSSDVAKEYGIETKRSKVGEANVVEKMIENNSMFGGEGSGGVIFRPVNFCRDSFVGMALILNLMEETGKKLSVLVDELPKYIMAKTKISQVIGDRLQVTENQKLKDLFKNGDLDDSDGLRFDFSDSSWIQIRASNTEPIVRIYGEAKTQERIDELVNLAKKTLSY